MEGLESNQGMEMGQDEELLVEQCVILYAHKVLWEAEGEKLNLDDSQDELKKAMELAEKVVKDFLIHELIPKYQADLP
jgi:F420-0:gamma-glutamyl ligase